MDLRANSIILKKRYIKLPIILYTITTETISKKKLFKSPFDIPLLMAQNSKDFRKLKRHQIEDMINNFPLHHDKFVAA
jgi:hypothetical protein